MDLEDAVSKRTGQEMDKATLDSKIQELELKKMEIVRAHEEIVAKNEDNMKVAVEQLKGSIVSVKKTVVEKDKTIGELQRQVADLTNNPLLNPNSGSFISKNEHNSVVNVMNQEISRLKLFGEKAELEKKNQDPLSFYGWGKRKSL